MVLLKLWDRMEEQVGGLFLLAAVLLVFAQIVLRAGFGIGISGIYELAAFCSTFSVFLTASLGVKRNTHIRVDLLSNIVPRKAAFALELFVQVLMLGVFLCLLYSGYLLVEESLLLGDHTTGTIEVPMWIPQLIMPVAGLLLTLRTLQRIFFLLHGGIAAVAPSAAELPVT
ncbi:TRAP transporter small permease [Aquabacter spiritensis]|uniref:TRAP transporter small permease protein n=1 Tax=Aquabacter spiritensis TaxID=933073 RepID=A0A4R3LMT4_9HYPH|nr:TRAP transporter small permease subunit [Aquabacter spiritensis]TCT01710.1 TRAP-type C4-dicarboxylate transport system permease small subunit [Aquabacter spiritensis]